MADKPKLNKVTICVPWLAFVVAGMKGIAGEHTLMLANPKFMKKGGVEPDHEVWDVPDYVEIEISNT